MTIGPVEYLVISFPGNQFRGEIAPAIAELVEGGTVRILDLAFVRKDADGTITAFEYDALEELAPFADLDGESDGLFSEIDLLDIGDSLEPNSSAALLLWEDLWAARLAGAIRDAGGVILAGERIPHAIINDAIAALAAS